MCKTRWWFKGRSLKKVLRSFNIPDGSLCIGLIVMLAFITNDKSMKPHVRDLGKSYKENLLKYENI